MCHRLTQRLMQWSKSSRTPARALQNGSMRHINVSSADAMNAKIRCYLSTTYGSQADQCVIFANREGELLKSRDPRFQPPLRSLSFSLG